MDNIDSTKVVVPEVKISGKRKSQPTGIELEVSKLGVLGQSGMDEGQKKAIERMLKELDAAGQ